MLGLAHSDSRSDCCACHPCRPHHGKQTRSGGAAPRALLWAPLTQAVASVVLGRLPQRHGAFADVQPVRTRRSKSAAAPAAAADAAADAAAKEVMCMLRTGEWLRAGKDTARQAQVAALRPGACTAIGRSHQSPRVTAGEKKRGHGCFIGLQARLERAVADREECMGGEQEGWHSARRPRASRARRGEGVGARIQGEAGSIVIWQSSAAPGSGAAEDEARTRHGHGTVRHRAGVREASRPRRQRGGYQAAVRGCEREA